MDHPDFQRKFIVAVLLLLIKAYIKFMGILLDADSYEQEDDEVLAGQLIIAELTSLIIEKRTPCRVYKYVEVTVPGQTREEFRQHFRMTPDTFEILLCFIGPQLRTINKHSPITKLMDPKKQLLAVLWLLSSPDSYRSVGDRFNMGKSSLHVSFINVVKLLNKHSKKFIKWPEGEVAAITEKQFRKISGIHGIIGAIDGTYIAIKAPMEKMYPERYVNRKCFHAITLQAVCNANLIFTDIFAGYPSSVSDSRIFKNSDLYKNIMNGTLHIVQNHFIIGDKAYPVLSWCIAPFIDRGNLGSREKLFNSTLSKSRQCIERAFALLKGRFRRLKYIDMTRTDLIPFVILACTVLHNICIFKENVKNYIEEYIEEGINSVQGEETGDDVEDLEVPSNLERHIMEGHLLRRRLMSLI